MRNLFPRRSTLLALLSIAGLSLAALIAIRHDAPPAVVRQKVLVTFEGPWAFAVDPDDATSIFAFAPKTMSHHDMVVKSSESEAESEPLAAGVYEVILQIPPEARRNTAVDSKILHAKIDAQGVQHALLARGNGMPSGCPGRRLMWLVVALPSAPEQNILPDLRPREITR